LGSLWPTGISRLPSAPAQVKKLEKEIQLTLPNSNEEILLLHNPSCSKSRATLALLEERGIAFETRLYLENPLGQDELADLGQRLGKSALEFTRTGQAEFKDANLSASSSVDEIFTAMATSPILLERPILIRGTRAAIGRPPEDVLKLLDDK
jgi:arsenate reductase